MISPFLPIESGFDVRKQAERLGVSWWRTPTFLFAFLGGVTISSMVGIFFVFSFSDNLEMVVLVESSVAIGMLFFGGLIIHLLEEMAVTSKLKTDFISTTAHKLKSPLAQIKWYIELFREKNSTNEKNEEFLGTLQKIESANERLIRMVDELLNVARIDSGSVRLYREKMDIMPLIRRVCARHKAGAEEKRIRITVKPPEGDGEIFADARKIETVMDNLVLNAIHYTERSGSIEIRAIDRGKEMEICVQDTGIGIPTAYQKRIFEKFFRADNAVSVNEEGSGLGLYLCQKIMEQIGGRIWFQSKEKSGSVFCIAFPKRKK